MLSSPCTKEELRKANRRSDAWEVYKSLLANSGYLEKSYEEIARESYRAVEAFEKFSTESKE